MKWLGNLEIYAGIRCQLDEQRLILDSIVDGIVVSRNLLYVCGSPALHVWEHEGKRSRTQVSPSVYARV